MIELDRSLIDTYFDEAVAEFGEDYIYSQDGDGSCKYVRDGAPSCLVGQVLAKAGVPLERLKEADWGGSDNGTSAQALLKELAEEGILSYDIQVISLLSEAQCRQDTGYTWGAAVRAARNTL